jgi:cytochrome c-type biogenesis protein CcmH/NrfG
MFIFLALVFAGGFIFFGVGSGTSLFGDLGGIFGSNSSSSTSPSITELEKKLQKNPKDTATMLELGREYQTAGDTDSALATYQQYLALKPRDPDALISVIALYQTRAQSQSDTAQLAAYDAQAAQPPNLLPPSDTKVGQAFGTPDPVAQAIASQANQRYNDALTALQGSLSAVEDTYRRLAAVQPDDANTMLGYGQAAEQARDLTTALRVYRQFIRRFPEDTVDVRAVKQRIAAIQSQLTPQSSSQG